MSNAYFSAKKAVAVVLDAQMPACEALMVGVAGNVAAEMADPALPAGSATVVLPVVAGINPISARRIITAGTTATGLFALY